MEELAIDYLSDFVNLKVVALKYAFSFELAAEKTDVSISDWDQVRTLLQKLVS